ncbi:RNA polymerase-binding protein DksA [Rhodoferax aquaticus]|nr:RNA polymerase-binding protein DksA [Rhodoferax aquaticus]
MKSSNGKDAKAKDTKSKAKSAKVEVAKAAKAEHKVPAKAAAKPAPKAVSKPVAKAVAKPAEASVPKASKSAKKSVETSVAPVATKKSVKPVVATEIPKAIQKVQANTSAAKPVASEANTTSAVPAKAGRPSSRLAQLTVPSMAQSVASTSAKASFFQSAPAPVIIPALASSIKKDPKLANNWKTKPAAELSDAELMAMPDSEYMNEVQLAVFRLKLLKLKTDILSNAGETTEHLREDTSVVPDPADRATIEEEHALELRTRDRERKLLKKIEQSIIRIDADDYGYCDETGEPIGVGRLLARPTATLSLEAQQRRELKQKMFGD